MATDTAKRSRLFASCSVLTWCSLVLLIVAGCSSPGAALPRKTAGRGTPASSPAPTPTLARSAVIAAYTAYFPASKAAERAAPARARGILAPYAAPSYLRRVLSQMASYRARHQRAWGQVIPHITRVQVRGALARIYDCQDASHAALANARTGQVIQGTRGSARTFLIAGLSRGSDGRWRLTSLAHVAVPCNPAL